MPTVVKLVQVRCRNVITKKFWDGNKEEACDRLLVKVKNGTGESVCPRCGHKTSWEVKS